MSNSSDQKTLESDNGEYWFVGDDHDGEIQLYDWMEEGPQTTAELRSWLNKRGVNWMTALAADHFGISLDSVITTSLVRSYADFKKRPSDETVPWKKKAQVCCESAAMACKLIDKGDFETAMLYVASAIHTAHGATKDKQSYDAMRNTSRHEKAKRNSNLRVKEKESKEQRTIELVDLILREHHPRRPSKTTLKNYLLKNYKKEVLGRDELSKTISKHLKKRGIQLEPYSQLKLETKEKKKDI